MAGTKKTCVTPWAWRVSARNWAPVRSGIDNSRMWAGCPWPAVSGRRLIAIQDTAGGSVLAKETPWRERRGPGDRRAVPSLPVPHERARQHHGPRQDRRPEAVPEQLPSPDRDDVLA